MRVQKGVFILYALDGKNHHVNILHLYLGEKQVKKN